MEILVEQAGLRWAKLKSKMKLYSKLGVEVVDEVGVQLLFRVGGWVGGGWLVGGRTKRK